MVRPVIKWTGRRLFIAETIFFSRNVEHVSTKLTYLDGVLDLFWKNSLWTPMEDFDQCLAIHTDNVVSAFDRVFEILDNR